MSNVSMAVVRRVPNVGGPRCTRRLLVARLMPQHQCSCPRIAYHIRFSKDEIFNCRVRVLLSFVNATSIRRRSEPSGLCSSVLPTAITILGVCSLKMAYHNWHPQSGCWCLLTYHSVCTFHSECKVFKNVPKWSTCKGRTKYFQKKFLVTLMQPVALLPQDLLHYWWTLWDRDWNHRQWWLLVDS